MGIMFSRNALKLQSHLADILNPYLSDEYVQNDCLDNEED